MILYLLPFTSGTEFKFGITKSNRINKIHSLYSIDFNKAKIISAKDDHTIRYLENEIKSVFRGFISNKYAGQDGATEILPVLCWNDVIKLIENRKSFPWLEIKLEDCIHPLAKISFAQFTKVKDRTVRSVKASKVKRDASKYFMSDTYPGDRYTDWEYEDFYEGFDAKYRYLLKHRYGQKMLEAAKEGKNEITYLELENPGIVDFKKRIEELCLECDVKKTYNAPRVSGIGTAYASISFLQLTEEFEDEKNRKGVRFVFTSAFLKEVASGRVDNILETSPQSNLVDVFCSDNFIPYSKEEVRNNYGYLANNFAEFEAVFKVKYSDDARDLHNYMVNQQQCINEMLASDNW